LGFDLDSLRGGEARTTTLTALRGWTRGDTTRRVDGGGGLRDDLVIIMSLHMIREVASREDLCLTALLQIGDTDWQRQRQRHWQFIIAFVLIAVFESLDEVHDDVIHVISHIFGRLLWSFLFPLGIV
jgi:hypothetical protein